MKRILILTPRFPFPVLAGDTLRIYYLCKELSKTHRLTLLSICEKSEMEEPVDSSVFSEVHRVYHPGWRRILQTLLALPTSTPLQLAYFYSKDFNDRLVSLVGSHDLVLAHLIRAGQFIDKKNLKIPTILEMTDAISLNYQRINSGNLGKVGFQGLRNRFLRFVYRFEQQRLHDYEKKILNNFDLVSLVSDADRSFLVKNESERNLDHVRVYPNGVELERYPFDKSSKENFVVFIGNIRTLPNLDACIYFATEILPIIRQKHPVTFKVVGSIPPSAQRILSKIPNVEVTGRVPSIAKAVSGGFCGVCPVRIGAGIQNKVLEYMALGLPAIVTSVGLEGISATPGKDLLVGDNNQEIADQVMTILENPPLGMEIASNARQFIEKYYDWDHVLAPFQKDVSQLMENKGNPTLE
jgi:glycosyltransferase involved in cell wall biosynthesis